MIALSVAKLNFFFRRKAKILSEYSQNRKKNYFCGKFGSITRLEVCEKARNVFVTSLRMSDLKVLHIITSSLSFFDFTRIFTLFSLVFRTSKFLELMNLIKQLFHSRLLDMRLVIANSARRLFTISYPTGAHGIIVQYIRIFSIGLKLACNGG